MLALGPPLAPDARLLVRLPSWLGDLVQCEPALAALCADRARRGGRGDGAGLTLVAPERILSVLDGRAPAARRVAAGSDGAAMEAWRGHDAALLFTNSFRSAWQAWRARIPRRIGWARDGRGWLLTDAMVPAREGGRAALHCGVRGRGLRYLPRPFAADARELLGLVGVSVARTAPCLAVRDDAREAVAARLAGQGVEPERPLLLLNAGGRPGSAKAVPAELWARAIAALRARPSGDELAVALVCGPGEESGPRQVLAALAGPGTGVDGRVLDWSDPAPDLARLAALASRARLAWTADGGVLHVLRALGTPRVVLFGPTDPRHSAETEFGADGRALERRLRVPVPCGPCHRERCPLGAEEERRCFRAIEPEDLAEASERLLG